MERAIDRLRDFAKFVKESGRVRGESSFEAYCGLSNKYLANTSKNNKGAIGSDIIGRVAEKFPELNIDWLCTGRGVMICPYPEENMNYKKAYEGALMQIEALTRIVNLKEI